MELDALRKNASGDGCGKYLDYIIGLLKNCITNTVTRSQGFETIIKDPSGKLVEEIAYLKSEDGEDDPEADYRAEEIRTMQRENELY